MKTLAKSHQCLEINQASCDIAKKVSMRKGTSVAGGIMQTGVYKILKGTAEAKNCLLYTSDAADDTPV